MQHYKERFSPAHRELLSHFSMNLMRGTLSHALLFHGLDEGSSHQFLLYLSAMLLCPTLEKKPCEHCQSCQLVLQGGHPDLTEIKPDKKISPIKIESIRDLNDFIYLSPQLGLHRVVIIKRAEKMNLSASNALLKLLEEPPNNVYFILQALQLSTILPTVLSRCQRWQMTDQSTYYHELNDCVEVSPPNDPELAKVVENLPRFFSDIEGVITQQKQLCAVAASWLDYDLHALVTMLYWINSTLIKSRVGQPCGDMPLNVVLPYLTLPQLFGQLDKLNTILRRLNQSVAINALLTLEDFLLGYVR